QTIPFGADKLQCLARSRVALLGSEREERCRHGIVARESAPVRVYPPEAKLRFRIAAARRLAVQSGCPDRVFRNTLPVFISHRLGDETRRNVGLASLGNLLGGNRAGCERECARHEPANTE